MPAFSSLADLVRYFESGSAAGNYTAQNPNSTSSGAYGFVNSTWLHYAPAAGVDTSQYPTAGSAPAALQDAVFNQAVAANGLSDWTCAGCDPKLAQYLTENPSARSLPVSGGATAPATTTGTTAATGAAPSASAGFYVIAVVLVVFLLAAGMWGLIRG